ncbi:MEDS domain-containing protein [Candidatus Nitrosocosmicus arcticus]|nr:MEDS domain-containing protein [Candidatus Nitrosocosmicus arcticus]
MHVENASNTISESDYGTHTLVVYQDLETLREFYSYYVKKRVEEKNEVIQLAPFYETEDSVRKSLSKGQISIDIEKWEKDEKALIIIDSLKKYLGIELLESDYNSNKNLVEYAKAMGKSGVSILGDKGAFPYRHRMEDLVNYELSLPSKYDMDLKRVCLYHKKDFNRLSEDQKQKLVNHHLIAIKI